MSIPTPKSGDENRELKVLSFNVWGLVVISKDRITRIRAIAEYLASVDYDIVCLQELWIYKEFELVRDEVLQNLPFSRFFHTGALGSGLAIFTRYPIISAEALPYSLSGLPLQVAAGDFFVNKAAGNIVILHPFLGEVEIWNTHMHAAGEDPPDTRQAHRIAQSWQLANAIRSGAAKGRYILAMGDFNSQPYSIPIEILRTHAGLSDSFLEMHPTANSSYSTNSTLPPRDAIQQWGMTCDSPLNTYSHGKPIPIEVTNRGGKRLDYIFFRQPEVARRRPLIWGQWDGTSNSSSGSGARHSDNLGDDGGLEEGRPIQASVDKAPILRCTSSEITLTGTVPGQSYSYSDHFGILSTFAVDAPDTKLPTGIHHMDGDRTHGHDRGAPSNGSFEPLLSPSDTSPSLPSASSTYQPSSRPTRNGGSGSGRGQASKSVVIRSALHTLRLYTRISQGSAKTHLRLFVAGVVVLLGLTIGSAWQPKSWLQPIFTLLGGVLGAGGATLLYTGFIWGRWEMGLLTEVTEEMELELRITDMEERRAAK